MALQIAVPKEITPLENRVALVPQLVPEYQRLQCNIQLQHTAGESAGYTDAMYHDVVFKDNAPTLLADTDIVLKVQPLTPEEITTLKPGTVTISLLHPQRDPDTVELLRKQQITSFAINWIPRISRAQSMDALSSQASIAGYKAVLIAANMTNRFIPMLTTAAGTIRPLTVLIIGTGVAGLQAIATAKRLGAIVQAYDVRTATKKEVESLGAKMIDTGVDATAAGGYARELTEAEKQQQQEVLLSHLKQSDIIITTAQIPGKPAPVILNESMIAELSANTIIIDVAAESGGNCALTKPDEIVQYKHVTLYGPTNLPSQLARDASFLYSRNLLNFTKLLLREGKIQLDLNDQIIADSLVTHEGKILPRHKGGQ